MATVVLPKPDFRKNLSKKIYAPVLVGKVSPLFFPKKVFAPLIFPKEVFAPLNFSEKSPRPPP